jgi:ADP-ribosylglycohydrolase
MMDRNLDQFGAPVLEESQSMNLLDRYRGAMLGLAAGDALAFEHGALLAVNLGDDADTTGAVYGQLAGAYYGVQGIPGRWRLKLAHLGTIEKFSERLMRGAW